MRTHLLCKRSVLGISPFLACEGLEAGNWEGASNNGGAARPLLGCAKCEAAASNCTVAVAAYDVGLDKVKP